MYEPTCSWVRNDEIESMLRQLGIHDAEIERLKALLETGREIVEQYAPGFELWLEEVDAALTGKELT